ncbi:putative F-box only protein 32 [Sciurus carolinensis]|uniref:F-box only protein 32 n=1 Tax=Sciurus carolinensis TaxID=30640 RepID=A0AA41N823_SCICA|nr:putative F-box only protein 32 [Sciurus carolinensis]
MLGEDSQGGGEIHGARTGSGPPKARQSPENQRVKLIQDGILSLSSLPRPPLRNSSSEDSDNWEAPIAISVTTEKASWVDVQSDLGAAPASSRPSPAGEPQEDWSGFQSARPRLGCGSCALGAGRGRGGARGLRGGGRSGLARRPQVSTGARLCNGKWSESRGRLRKQAEPINKATWPRGRGGRAKSRRSSGNKEPGPAAQDKYCGRDSRAALPEPDAQRDPPQNRAL